MKKLLVFAFLLTCLISFSQNRETNTNKDKYISKVLDSAFNLSVTNKVGDAMKLCVDILESYPKLHDTLKLQAYNTMGISFTQMSEFEKGRDYFIKKLNIEKKLNNIPSIIISYSNIGLNYKLSGDLEKSNEYFRKSLSIDTTSNYKVEKSFPLSNLADNLIYNSDQVEKGLEYLDKCFSYYSNDRNPTMLNDIYKAYGVAYVKLKNYNKALDYFNKAINYSESINYLNGIWVVENEKAKLYEVLGRYTDANTSLKRMSVLKDSITVIENRNKAAKIEAEYASKQNQAKLEFLEKEKEIQQQLFTKSKTFNIILLVFSALLLLTSYFVFKNNRLLKKARDKAERLSKTKSSFYSEISHELRTPLYAVIELSSILLKENTNPKHLEYLKSLNFSGNHLLALVNNVLHLNKLEYRKMKVNNNDFQLNQVVGSVIDSMEFALHDSNNKMLLNYDSTIPNTVIGDSLKLSQILINLLSNANKFTEQGNIYIDIKKVNETSNNVDVFFKITDEGVGIPQNKINLIFQEFFQDTNATKKSYKGTGLGLSIVKRMLVAMGSNINIESTLGKGTSFSFTLTLQKQTGVLEDKHNDLEDYVKQLKQCEFLIVDDNRINQLVTRKILDQFGLKTSVLSSGKEALEAVKQNHYDCILMDLHMPEMDGYQATNYIREFNKNVAIVALTAASQEEVEKKISELDMQGYIMKPFVINSFIKTIFNAIKAKQKIEA